MEENNNQQPPLRRRRRRKIRWGRLLFLLIFVGLLGTALYHGTFWIYNKFINPPHVGVTAADNKIRDDQKLNERINVLLLGIDDGDSEAAESEPKRTDAIILLSFDPQNNKVAVLSIPRDTMVVLPGHKDPEKINAAFAYGGVVMAKQTVANLLRVPIHYYALANWRGFIDVVNLIGGVDIYVEKDMYYEDPYANLVIDIKHGYQHMDGETAGKYVRFRKDELGDIGRVQRQQKFLKAAAEQMFSVQNVTKVSSLLATLDKYVETDLNTLTMLKAANSFKLFGDDKLRSCMLYGKFDDSTGVSYWRADQADVNKSLDELGIPYLKEKEEEKPEVEEEPKEHLQPKDRDELEQESTLAGKVGNN
ncbi:LCP family protein [uncultured Phascolarctobacterium sp.]|uniref:LCP family protein n=1 Tax=uncultured Phascolarctobacterium sp. TaxID=512296 RepID=UPI0025F43689|nr:LCP family protein [uncultured Phascolarctobacterium sp.]